MQGVEMMVDLCRRGWTNDTADDSHCLMQKTWKRQPGTEAWAGGWPLQVGGLAWKVNMSVAHSSRPRPLKGCLSHIAVNGQVRRGQSGWWRCLWKVLKQGQLGS